MPKNNWKKILKDAKFRILVSDEANLFSEIEEFSDSLDFRGSILQLIFYLGRTVKLSISVAGNPVVQQQLPRDAKSLRELVIEAIEKENGSWIEDFVIEESEKKEKFIEFGKDWERLKKEIGKAKQI